MPSWTSILATAGLATQAVALQNKGDLGKLPALGWNSWNAYHCDVSETKILQAAQSFIDLGLKAAGYEYVNIDDCWSVQGKRDSQNRIIPDPTKFPNGISGVASKIHSMGLKIGIYSSAGLETCAGYPASLYNEDVDAATFASWGIDYLKYDNCGYPSNWTDTCFACYLNDADGPNGTCINTSNPRCASGYNYDNSHTFERYARMRDALNKQSRPILYSLCEWGTEDVVSWGSQVGHSWRTTGDIDPSWSRVMNILNQNSFFTNAGGFYGHNDPDMLEVGNGLTTPECRSHFALWAAMKSPLLIGTNLQNLSTDLVDILKNPYLLAFNQDSKTSQAAAPYKWGYNPDWTFDPDHPAQYWSGESGNGTLVLMLNTANTTQTMQLRTAEIPQFKDTAARRVVDVWTGESLGCTKAGTMSFSVQSHDTAAVLVKDTC